MSYNPVFFITNAEVNDSQVVLTLSGSPTIANRSVTNLVFARGVQVPATAESTFEVVLEIEGTQYPLNDKFGMPLTLGEIPKTTNAQGTYFAVRTPIACGVGSTGETPAFYFIAFNLPYPSAYIIPLR